VIGRASAPFRSGHPVSHGPVAVLTPVPHPQQCRMPGIREVADAHLGLAGLLAMQDAGDLHTDSALRCKCATFGP
jgi:hypothetical protein